MQGQLLSYRFINVVFTFVAFAHASSSMARDQRFFDGRVVTGSCQMATDPNKSFMTPFLCLQGTASSEMQFRFASNEENLVLNYLQGYGGLHLHKLASLHAEGRRLKLFNIVDTDAPPIKDEQKTESLFLQIGNPALHKVRLSVGRLAMPFGLNHQPGPMVNTLSISADRYWLAPRHVARLTIDNQSEAQLEIGVAQNESPIRKARDIAEPESRAESSQALSVRFAYDISALDGTRILMSGYGQKDGQRRYGIGLLNRAPRGDLTSFEWAMWRDTPGGRGQRRQQFFRFAFEGGFVTDSRIVFNYETEERDYRLVTLGQDFKVFPFAILRISISYYYPDRDPELSNRWLATAGVQVIL